MKKVLLLFALLLIVGTGMVLSQNYLKEGRISLFKKSTTVTINDHKFEVMVSDSQKEREIGLSKTQSLSQNQGMIFIFEKPDYYYFWMKNMKFPIDIIFINNDKIVTIKENAKPLKGDESPIIYAPTEPSNKVLEISAGLAEKYKLRNGDKVAIENL